MPDLLYRFSLAVVPRAYVMLSRVWFASCRVRVFGEEHARTAVADGPAVAVFWHYGIFFVFHQLRGYSAAVMVSASRDGEYIARIAKLMGHVPVRGSANVRGVAGLKHLLRAVRSGHHAGIVADGSQGPARIAQPGALLLAARTGSRIVPMAWAADRYLAFGSWDRTIVPLPFARIVFLYGEPFSVPRGCSAKDLETYRLEMEQRLNRLYDEAWQRVGRQPHDRK